MEGDEEMCRYIRVSMSCDSFMAALESMTHINGNSTDMTFTKDGFSTHTKTVPGQESTNPKKASLADIRESNQMFCKYPSEWLRHYEYDDDLGDVYSGQVSTSDLFNSVKNLKKQVLEFDIEVANDGSSSGLRIQVQKTTGSKTIKFNSQNSPTKYIDVYAKYCANKEAAAKPCNSVLKDIWSGIKHNSCTGINLKLNHTKSTLTVTLPIPQDPEFSFYYLSWNTGNGVEETDVVREIKLPTKSVITKTHKMSPNGITQIFISPETMEPIVLKTNIGNQGICVVSIAIRK